MAKQIKRKIQPMKEINTVETVDLKKPRPTYTLTIKNDVTGKVELKEVIHSIVGAIQHAAHPDRAACDHDNCKSASIAWGIKGSETKDVILDLNMSIYHLIAKREAASMGSELASVLGGMFAKPAEQEKKKASKRGKK